MKFKICLLFLLFSCAVCQHTYFGSYGKFLEENCCGGRIAEVNDKVNWEKNYLCNGDFQKPKMNQGKSVQYFKNVPCWKSQKQIQISLGTHDDGLSTQLLNLDPKSSGTSIEQTLDLYQGQFQLKFQYSPDQKSPLCQSAFDVYFNGVQILRIRPDEYGVTTIVITVNGRYGPNNLEFVENGKKKNIGVAIDNVGIYQWKTNCYAKEQRRLANNVDQQKYKEIQAVGAGYPVQYSSVYPDGKSDNYQLDAQRKGLASAWCPYQRTQIGNWIQVSATQPKTWTKVIIQGRGDADHRVSSFQLQYTTDGFKWQSYKNGIKLSGAVDRNTKVVHKLEPFQALTVRLVVTSYVCYSCMRWGAIFIQEEE